jgi:hypothetical protein
MIVLVLPQACWFTSLLGSTVVSNGAVAWVQWLSNFASRWLFREPYAPSLLLGDGVLDVPHRSFSADKRGEQLVIPLKNNGRY